MRSLSLTCCTTVAALAAAIFSAPHPAQAINITTPMGLSAAIQQSDLKQDVWWRRGYWGYRPYAFYRPYAYAYRPYYAYAYRPYYAYGYAPYAYRPYAYGYGYRPYAYGAYAYGGFGPRIWLGWGRRWW
jgi:hypothetical protein